MKKKKRVSIWKLLFTLLFLSSCGQVNNKNSGQNTRYFNENKYETVNKYINGLEWFVDKNMRYDITWTEYDSTTHEPTGTTKHWVVYLNGYYIINIYYEYEVFYECKKSNGDWDYYLIIS